VARTKERMEELNRRMSSSLSWGEEGCELLTPEQVVEKVPFVDPDVVLGGFYTPAVTVVDPLRAGTLMREYAQERGASGLAGSYAHRPILLDPDDIPSAEEAALSPTELPFTQEDFDPQLEQALELMPEILTVEGAGIRHAINGLLSLTPDGMPLLGETEVKSL